MKLFSSTQIAWTEPWCFPIRIRESREWCIRILLAVGISVVLFLVCYFKGAVNCDLPRAIGVGLLGGCVVMLLLDIRNIHRDVTVKEDSIIVDTNYGRGRFKTFQFDAIDAVRLIRPEEWSKLYGGMVIASAGEDHLYAIPNKVSLNTLANILHRLGVSVLLSGWESSEYDTRIGIMTQIDLDPAAAQGEINIQPVEAHEGPLLSPAHYTIQFAIALGPLLLALIGAIVVGVILFRNWSVMSVLDKSLYGGGAFLAVVAAFFYMAAIGQFVAAGFCVRAARNKLSIRPNAIFHGIEDDLQAVEIFDRESWTKAITKSSDFGFLRIDRPENKLLFEGNKFRWTLPTSALTACRIEECIVGSEGNPNPQKRYFVVIKAAKDGETWEAGMICTRTEMGNDTPESRYKRAQLLFMQLAEVV